MTREERLEARERILLAWEAALRQHAAGQITDDQLEACRTRADHDLALLDPPQPNVS